MGHESFKINKKKMSAFSSKSSIKPRGLANKIVYNLCSQIINFIKDQNYKEANFIDQTLLAKIMSHRWDYIKIDELVDFIILNTDSQTTNQDVRDLLINLIPRDKTLNLESLGEDIHSLVSMVDVLILTGHLKDDSEKKVNSIISSIWSKKLLIK